MALVAAGADCPPVEDSWSTLQPLVLGPRGNSSLVYATQKAETWIPYAILSHPSLN